MEPQAFQQILDSYKPQTSSPSAVMAPSQPAAPAPVSAPAAQPKQKGNWFSHLLPTIGSVAVPALGALLAPETGGLSLIAAAGLSGLGAAGGKAAENAVEGNSVGNDVLSSGVEGAAGGAAGGIAGKFLGKGAEFLAKRAGNITKTAAETATQKTAADTATNEAVAIKNNYGSISPRLQQDLKLGSNQNMLRGLGYDITDPYSLRAASLAGHDQAGGLSLNSIYDEALQGAKPVDMTDFAKLTGAPNVAASTPTLTATDLRALAKQGISPEVAAKGTITGGAEPATVNALSHIDPVSPVGKALQDFGVKPGEALPDAMPATHVRRLQQAVGKQIGNTQRLINNSELQGVSNTEAEGQLQALNDLYGQLGNKIKTPEVDAVIGARTATPEEREQLIEKFGPAHGNHIADTIDSAQGADDLLGHMQSYTQMGKLSDMAINDVENATATARAVARAKGDVNADGVADPVTPTVTDAIHAGMSGASHGGPTAMIAKALYQSKDNPAILDTLSRIGGLGEKLAPGVGAAVGASNAQLQSNGDTMGAIMPVANQDPNLMASSTVPQGGLTRDDLITLALYSPSAFNALVTPSAGQQQNVAAANTAEQALSSLGPAPSGGIMSQLAGHFGVGPTGEYQRKAAAAAQQVAAALPGADAGAIEKQLTNYLAGGASIDQAVTQLMQSLHATSQNNTNAPYQQLMNFHPSQPPSVVSAAGL